MEVGKALQHSSYPLKTEWMTENCNPQYSLPKCMQLKLQLRNLLKTTVTTAFSDFQSIFQALLSNTHNCAMIAEIQLLSISGFSQGIKHQHVLGSMSFRCRI